MAPLRSTKKGLPPRATDDTWLHDRAPGHRALRTRPIGTAPATSAPGSLSSKLLVTNLHYEISQKDLSAIFGQAGTLVREPLIRFDRSGRSLGSAIITFETSAEATRAKKTFHGVLAKGQPMSINYEAESAPRRASAPASLINRIQKAPLISRLGQAESDAKTSLLARTKKAEVARGVVRGRGRGGIGRGRAPAADRKAKPKSAQDLDGELDAFMSVGEGSTATKPPAPAATADGNGDVEMV